MSEETIFNGSEEKNPEDVHTSDPKPKSLNKPLFSGGSNNVTLTGWINDYTDDQEQVKYYIGFKAVSNGRENRLALFVNDDFEPYFRKAVEAYKADAKVKFGGDSGE